MRASEPKTMQDGSNTNNKSAQAERRRFLRFVISGGFAALINIGVRALLSQVMNFHTAIILAYIIAMITAYILSRLFVFEVSGQSVAKELTKFAIVNILALMQVWLVTVLVSYYFLPSIGWTLYPKLVAHIIGVGSPVFTSYFGHRYFSFRRATK